jgi:UDP-glucose 4-epimerase
MTDNKTILITGASGMVGQVLIDELAAGGGNTVVATDIAAPSSLPDGVLFRKMDVTTDEPAAVITEMQPDVIIHMASIVTPPKGTGRDFAYEVDVVGTRKVIMAAIENKVKRLVVTSSGAAYGYHADNSVPLRENDPVRGNEEFPYSHHKRLVEEMLVEARKWAPGLEQVILRVGTVLGEGTENQITAMFHKPKLLGLAGCDSPFVFIWTKDLARVLHRAATDGPVGIFNVAGDGAMGVSDLAQALGKKVMRLPVLFLQTALFFARPLGLSQYGPEQVRFLQYRPVLDNRKLKEEFGYAPELTSAEVFELWKRGANL